ncbi:MAG: two-component system sensor histidine kinase NtrB [Comamonas sp.]
MSAAAAPYSDAPRLRLWRGFLAGRLLVALLLAIAEASTTPSHARMWPIGVLAIYDALALIYAAVVRSPPAPDKVHAWLPTLGLDLLLITVLEFGRTGGFSVTPLLGLPVLIAGALGGWLVVLATCAYATLFLLVHAFLSAVNGSGGDLARSLFQAGISGAAYFGVGILVHVLAIRLERERLQTLRSTAAAHQQEQINGLVLQNLSDGVMVADARCRIIAANPAASKLLGRPVLPLALDQLPIWRPVLEQIATTFAQKQPLSYQVNLLAPGESPLGLQVHSWLTEPIPDPEAGLAQGDNQPLCVLFVHDVREMEARLRTEKMAAMGRMSAAVAHEIRNPLSAIMQANALLEEDLRDLGNPALARLTTIVRQNAERLSRIAEEVLDIARVQSQIQRDGDTVLELDAQVRAIGEEWLAQPPGERQLTLHLAADTSLVAFDAGHLRQLLVNLLDNAQRYHSRKAGALRVVTRSNTAGAVQMTVWSDGPAIDASVQNHLFEPFFSSESRSSGLGLYICRELCARHGAIIRYERQSLTSDPAVAGNAFVVQFRLPAQSNYTE